MKSRYWVLIIWLLVAIGNTLDFDHHSIIIWLATIVIIVNAFVKESKGVGK